MAVVLNGNGTITGISVGGLPDGIVDTDMLAASAVTFAKTTGLGRVIQVVSKIRTGSHFSTSSTSAQHISDFDADLTLSSSSNKVFILITGGFISQSDNYENRVYIKLYEGSVQSSDEIFDVYHGGLTLQSSTTHYCQMAAGAGFYHTPGKTNPTYKLSIQCISGGSNHIIKALQDRAVVTYFEVVG